ncbi:Gfo/Idh/MocA family protein [Microlunatus flavus]|uniref:Predicted dehydrogenase n=1 Tax=Microlunatus flavus TaxID=1036181 RepID=A0A1H9G303_9ACTN|nr:Gfo/Idh/MocA family oxidoreductase [Microlunatus flavus]SEQ44441.1 Predicted dehydrogenase [Microlunatus flavus]
MTTFAIVGGGWRAGMYLDVARQLGTVRCAAVVTPRPRLGPSPAPVFTSLDACLREVAVDFVLTATPRPVTPGVVVEAVDRGLPVLAETPPAADLEGLRALWSAVGASGLVQVAEQYLLMPSHAARAALVASGLIGTPTQVQVSSTQEYHAVSLVRGLLGAGRTPVAVRATRFTAPLVSPLGRGGWTDDEVAHPTTTTIATLDLGEGRSGVYDFTEQQTRNQLRFRRLTVRGSAGELHDDEVVRMTGPRTLVRSPLVRRQTGHDLDLIGYDTEHISVGDEVLYRNPYVGRRWMDEEIAMATLLERTAAWVHDEGPAPYPLAEGAHDQQVALAIAEAAETDATVTTTLEAWS